MFYGGAWIRRKGGEIFSPFSEENVDCSAYTMSLGEETFISSSSENFNQNRKTKLDGDSTIVIPAGQFAYLITKEFLSVPENVFALINIKNKFKVQGLINVSGFHVDPGYKGKLVFAVFNAGSENVFLCGEEKIFLIWFSELKESNEDHVYKKEGYKKITSDLMNQIPQHSASLSSLDSRLNKIEKRIALAISLISGIFITTCSGLILAYL